MERQIQLPILILLSILELWIGYQFLCGAEEKKYLKFWKKILIWSDILGLGILLGINRNMFYFSHTMFVIEIVIMSIPFCILYFRKWYVIVELIIIYNSILAMLDFFWAFCGMAFLKDFWHIIYVFGNSPWKCFLLLLSRGLMAFLVFRWNSLQRKEEFLEEAQKLLVMVAIVFLLLVRIYQYVIYNIMKNLSDIRAESAAGSIITVAIMAIFIVVVWWKYYDLRKVNHFLEMKEKLELNRLKEIDYILEQNRIQIHDMRHHLIILKEYAVRKEYSEIDNYLNQLLERSTEVQEKKWTQIHNLDIILCEKVKEAEKENIQFDVKADILTRLPFQEIETSALIGNLLDNAIEACRNKEKGEKKITIEIRQKKEFLFITVTNSIGCRPKEKYGKLVSSKKDKSIHGYGLKSVDRIVKKYNGFFEYEIKDEKFIARLLVLNPRK